MVGTAAKKSIVLLAVAALPKVVVKLPLAGYIASVPAVPEAPKIPADAAAIWPPVPVNAARSPLVVLVGPVVKPEPDPARLIHVPCDQPLEGVPK